MLHISKNNSKLGQNIPSVNLPPVITCPHNAPCFKKCYARKGRFRFSSVQKAMNENWELWQTAPEEYEKGIIKAAMLALFFRWHSAGDIPSMAYLEMMVRVADACHRTKFLAFTKQYDIVNTWLDEHGNFPENLTVVFSVWG